MKLRSTVSPLLLVALFGLACGQSTGTSSSSGKGGSTGESVTGSGGSGGKADTGHGGNGAGGRGETSDAAGTGGQVGSGGSAGGGAGDTASSGGDVAGRSGSGGTGGSTRSGDSTISGGRTSAGGSTSAGGTFRTGGTTGGTTGGSTGGSVAGQSGSAGTGGAGGTTGSGGAVAGSSGKSDAGTPSPDAATEAGTAQWLPCPTDGSACKILPYGDSITQGFPFAAQGGYRAPLFHLALADKKKVTFIGQLSDGPDKVDDVTFPKNHEGHFAMTIEWLTDSKNVPDSAIKPAHIILLHAGTNNRSGQPADAAGKLEALIDRILTQAPNALLWVSTIIPCGDNGPEDAFVRAYDPLIPPMVEKRASAGKHIRLVDQYASFTPATMFSPPEKYHPNLVGYSHMADVWYEAIKSVLP